VRQTALEAFQHQDVPFEQLVAELAPPRALATAPICQVVFALQNLESEPLQLGDIVVESIAAGAHSTHFDLTVLADQADDEIRMWWAYKRDLFEEWRIREMARHYLHILDTVVIDPQIPVGRIDMLSELERSELLDGQAEVVEEYR
jgi:non-ribosomal peptide synthetase component F